MSTEFNQPLFTGPLIPGDIHKSNAHFTKNVTITGDLRVDDIISTGALTVSGNVTFADGNLTATTAGISTMSAGTVSATTSTLSFFGTTPTFNQGTTSNLSALTSSFSVGASTVSVNVSSTFNGYTLGQVVDALQNYGLLA